MPTPATTQPAPSVALCVEFEGWLFLWSIPQKLVKLDDPFSVPPTMQCRSNPK